MENNISKKNKETSRARGMIFIMAWRNIWRNKTRSKVVIGAVIVGIWASIFMSGLSTGMVKSYISSAIQNNVSHIQIHHPDFEEDREVKYFIPNVNKSFKELETMPEIKAVGVRTLIPGMISSGRGAAGIEIKGVDLKTEINLTKLDEKIKEGNYFEGKRKNEILIGMELAEQLNVNIRKKVVLTFQDLNGEITAGAFRIAGIFDTGNNVFDETVVFVLKKDLNRILVGESQKPILTGNDSLDTTNGEIAHEIALLLNDVENLDEVQQTLKQRFPELSVKSYGEISPDLQLYESIIGSISLIYMILILLALIFGIINTMLMAVLERISELGMLMAIGMNKLRVFTMIVFETVMLSLAAVPFGVLVGFFTIHFFGQTGINLSFWSESLQEFGMTDFIYPEVLPGTYWQMALGVFITAVLASIYPAFRAIRLRPVEAIRKI